MTEKGVTLVEVMISLVVLLLVSLALMQTALVSIDANTTNVLRDEAVSIAETNMRVARNTDYDLLADAGPTPVTTNIRNIPSATLNYQMTRAVTVLNVGLETEAKQVAITVTWDWKENTLLNGNPYTYTMPSIVRRP